MSIQSNSKLIQDYYAAFNAKDMERLKSLLTDDVECHFVSSGFEKTTGKDEFVKMSQECYDAFPDMKTSIVNQVINEESGAVEGKSIGTHKGELKFQDWNIPATGKSVTMNFCEIYRFRNGKIASVHTYADNLSLLEDLGVRPERKAA